MPIIAFDPYEIRSKLNGASPVVTIGNFDGVHIGHGELLRRTSSRAFQLHAPALAITFDPHPQTLFSNRPHCWLCTLEQKAELLDQAGMDAVLVIPFTREFARQTAAQFCADVLQGTLNARELYIGYDFCMGSDQLSDLEHCSSIPVNRVQAVLLDHKPVSSTRIREALGSSDIDKANTMLGHPFTVRGEVIHGAGRGRSLLGVPTANLQTDKCQFMPPSAVYATSTRLLIEKKWSNWMQSVTSFCKNPTFNGNELSMETHILDFAGDIYGTTMEVSFIRELRKERCFPSLDALTNQLHADMETRRSFVL